MRCKVILLRSLPCLGWLASSIASAGSHPIPDYTMQVLVQPFPQPNWGPSADDLQLVWDDLVRTEVPPEPLPPAPPPGLAAVAWAFENVQQAWRLVLPIPSGQLPELALSAAEPMRELVKLLYQEQQAAERALAALGSSDPR